MTERKRWHPAWIVEHGYPGDGLMPRLLATKARQTPKCIFLHPDHVPDGNGRWYVTDKSLEFRGHSAEVCFTMSEALEAMRTLLRSSLADLDARRTAVQREYERLEIIHAPDQPEDA